MGAKVVDYRVSTLVVLCKDCGNDVGLYPARHKCQPVDRPAMPALPAQYTNKKITSRVDSSNRLLPSTGSSMASSPSPSFSSAESTPIAASTSSKWSSRLNKSQSEDQQEESVYYNNFAVNLPETTESNGKKLWGKVRQNEKWKQLSEKTKDEKSKQSGKLWGKLLQATQTVADKIPSREDRGAESDEDDWDGETHVSRILREYYERKRMRLPEWLFHNEGNNLQRNKSTGARDNVLESSSVDAAVTRTPSRRRLWEQDPDDARNKISSRERERQELRQQKPTTNSAYEERSQNDRYHHYKSNDVDRHHGYRREEDNSRYYESEGRNRTYDERITRNSGRHYDEEDSSHQPRHKNNTTANKYYDDREYSPSARNSHDTSKINYNNRYEQRQHDLDHYYYNSKRDGDSNNPRSQQTPAVSKERAARYYNNPPPPDFNGRRREPSTRREDGRYYNDSGYF